MNFSYKIHKSGSDKLLAVCDRDILGKDFENTENNISINPEFYHEEFADASSIINKMRDATMINVIGKNAVDLIVKNNLAKKEDVIDICGLQHVIVICV